MSKNLIEKIISDEIEGIITEHAEEQRKELYVFDFDDTLVTDKATVYVVCSRGKKRPISTYECHKYTLQPGEDLDMSEFAEVTDPTVHEEILNLLKQHLPNSMILTARTKAKPIRAYMDTLGISVPRIVACGIRDATNIAANAERKKMWLDHAIESEGLEYVEMWDDNEANIREVNSLRDEYPHVEIVTHLVNHASEPSDS